MKNLPSQVFLDLTSASLVETQKYVKQLQPTASPLETLVIAIAFELARLRERIAELERTRA